MKRRRFLKATPIVVTPTAVSSTVAASSDEKAEDIDFEKLITEFYSDLPDDSEELRQVLEDSAHTIHQNGSKIDKPIIDEARSSAGKAQKLVRRTQFVVQILHNNDMGNYIEEAWVATARNRLGVGTRFLPLIGSFNNLYFHAKRLDEAVEEKQEAKGKNSEEKLEVEDEKYERYGYGLLAFAIEMGFFCYGTPYKMAWQGTRFLSNYTLLRVGKHLDNKLIALIMSEIHWKIRESIYNGINSENLKALEGLLSSAEYLKYVLDEMEDLKSFAESEELNEDYLEDVDLDIDRETLKEWDLKELSENSSDDGGGGIGSFL